jgi:hypothetical protein
VDPITLQDLLDELAREGGNLTDFLAAAVTAGRISVEHADALLTEAQGMAEVIVNAETRTAADVATLTTLADAVDAVRETRTGLVETAAAEAQAISDLAARIAPTATDTEPEGEPEAADEPEAAEPEVVVPDDASSITEPEVVVASTPALPTIPRPRVDVAAIARRTQRPAPVNIPEGGNIPFGGALVASAGAPGGRSLGQVYNTWDQVGDAAMSAFGSMSRGQLQSLVASASDAGVPFRQQTGLASFRMEFPDELVIEDTGRDSTSVLALAADQSRLPGGSLIAAGGWCSPSETMYDLCELPCSLDGILSLPEVLASRGGIRYTKGLNFEDIYNGTGYFHFTEAQMMAEPRPDKPCMEIPCPTFVDVRLDVDGLCITGDIMQNRTYPEVVAQFIQGAMCAHAHRVNAFKIAAISAGSTNDGAITMAGLGATNSILYAIELEVMAYRYRGRRSQADTSLLELVAPFWIKAVIRADIANRNAPSGIGNPQAVSDAEIVQWFASRGVAVQFVYDWQDLIGVNEDDPGTAVVDYPNTVEFILYEAGTWVVPSLDVITLDTLYDSTLIKQNKYQALFTEQAFAVTERCFGSRRFSVPVCANGNTGLQVAAVCA